MNEYFTPVGLWTFVSQDPTALAPSQPRSDPCLPVKSSRRRDYGVGFDEEQASTDVLDRDAEAL